MYYKSMGGWLRLASEKRIRVAGEKENQKLEGRN
jgi:hypothetical protein